MATGCKVKEQMDLVLLRLGADLQQFRQIVLVEGKNKIECREVSLLDLSGVLSGNIDAVFFRNRYGARVWRITRMPSSRPGRIHQQPIHHTLRRCLMYQDTFGQRRAANIAHADKKNGFAFHKNRKPI